MRHDNNNRSTNSSMLMVSTPWKVNQTGLFTRRIFRHRTHLHPGRNLCEFYLQIVSYYDGEIQSVTMAPTSALLNLLSEASRCLEKPQRMCPLPPGRTGPGLYRRRHAGSALNCCLSISLLCANSSKILLRSILSPMASRSSSIRNSTSLMIS